MADASARDYKETLVEALCMFRCCKDLDVQDFLNDKAIDFETRGWATTYLLLNKTKMESGTLWVEGYFSLSQKAILFQDGVSGSVKNRIGGFKTSKIASCVLIGQLGKYMSDESGELVTSSLTSKELLEDALAIVQRTSDLIVNRNVIIECKPIEKIQSLYLQHGFQEMQFDGKLHTMYLKLENPISF